MKTIKRVYSIAVASSIFIGVNLAYAQENTKPIMICQHNFIKMDTNKDNKVSLLELSVIRQPRRDTEDLFISKDTNRDGLLTREEFCSKAITLNK